MTGKRGSGRGPRPQAWVTGPDPVLHEQYRVWIQTRNQARFRGEGWRLKFEDFVEIWGTQWDQRGRERHCLQMMRDDYDRAWSPTNVVIVDRTEFHRRQAIRKKILKQRKERTK